MFAILSGLPLAAAQAVQLWGLTPGGGANGLGVLFKYQPQEDSWEVLHHFGGPDGASPRGGLLHASDGKLYGVACAGGADNAGLIFSFDPPTRRYAVERELNWRNGGCPQAQPIEGPGGLIFGVATYGGLGDRGVLYKLNPKTKGYSILHRFRGDDGSNPRGRLVWHGGRLYGTAWQGGAHSRGTVFSLLPNGEDFAVHHHFDLSAGGTFPYGGLTEGGNDKLYGFTATGGSYLYELDAATAVLTPLAQTDGLLYGEPVLGQDGRIYGASATGGSYGRGFMFVYDPQTGDYSRRFSPVPWGGFGWAPQGSLSAASNGRFYGLAAAGGIHGGGVLYEYSFASDTYRPARQLEADTGSEPAISSPIKAELDVPATRVEPGLCGRGLSLYQDLTLKRVARAQTYEIEIYADPGLTDLLGHETQAGRRFPLAAIGAIDWGGTYTVRAKATQPGRHSAYGPPCELRILAQPAAVPPTRIAARLASAPISPYTRLHAEPVPGATEYRFEIAGLSPGQWSGSGRNGFALVEAGLLGWDRDYEIRARVALGPQVGDWGEPVAVRTMPEPSAPPVGTVSPADCGATRSIYQRLRAEPVAGASAYRFEIASAGTPLAELRSPWPYLELEEVDGLRWGGQYGVRVKPEIGPIEGVWGPTCGLSIAPNPVYGLYSQKLSRRDCGATVDPADTIRTQDGIWVSEYQWRFAEDEAGASPVASVSTSVPRLALSEVPGLRPGTGYWVWVRGNVGPFDGPEGPACRIHLQDAAGADPGHARQAAEPPTPAGPGAAAAQRPTQG